MQPLSTVSGERNQFSARLKAALASAHGLPPSPTIVSREFNHRFGGKPVTVHAVRKWLVGEAIPTQDKLRELAKWLDVSVEWLRFGGGSERATDIARRGMDLRLSPQEQIIYMFSKLPQRERKLAQDFIAMLGKKNHRAPSKRSSAQESLNQH